MKKKLFIIKNKNKIKKVLQQSAKRCYMFYMEHSDVDISEINANRK